SGGPRRVCARPVLGDLRHRALASAPTPAEVVLREQLEIPGNGLAAFVERMTGDGHSRLRGLVMKMGSYSRNDMVQGAGHSFVMPGFVPGITSLPLSKTWTGGPRPATMALMDATGQALACLRNSVRSALLQSGTALILFSRSRISDCSCM